MSWSHRYVEEYIPGYGYACGCLSCLCVKYLWMAQLEPELSHSLMAHTYCVDGHLEDVLWAFGLTEPLH